MFEIPTGLFNTGGLGIADLESGKLPVQSWQIIAVTTVRATSRSQLSAIWTASRQLTLLTA